MMQWQNFAGGGGVGVYVCDRETREMKIYSHLKGDEYFYLGSE